ncbi:glycosyltransferase family 4 protein [Stieleria sp. ICT_E10.1]|uniref:glycosyltransferase family 4 protein n=1 Tax=Stieleria sedimenti TaxID=2976331 RepID=UPI00218061B1|nr:glycosyltransferase family 4 protein [Stieleria sedimenti]MCS7465770.1 glycosyltransferase family 4 protein [Stieleria sedimenti]
MSKKIALVAATQGDFGGIEAFVMTVADFLVDSQGYEVRVVFKRVKGCHLDKLKTKLGSRYRSPVYFVQRNSRELREHIRWADLLHVQNLCPDAILPAFFLRRPILATIHNYQRREISPHRIVWSACNALVGRRFYNSTFVWKTWEPRGPKPNSECVPTVCSLSSPFVPIERRRGFLFVGRWIPNKGLDDLIEAYARARLDRAAWPLTILGDGPLRGQILDRVSVLGLQSSVRSPGFVDGAEKERQIASCKWLVAAANTKEDMGLTPIEARAARTGVIVSRDGGLPESGGPAALIVPPGNVQELANVLEQAAAMGETEYVRRCDQGFDSLADYLKPMTHYTRTYERLLSVQPMRHVVAVSSEGASPRLDKID